MPIPIAKNAPKLNEILTIAKLGGSLGRKRGGYIPWGPKIRVMDNITATKLVFRVKESFFGYNPSLNFAKNERRLNNCN